MTMYAETRDLIRLCFEVFYAAVLAWMSVTLLMLIYKHNPSKAALLNFWTIYDIAYYALGAYALYNWMMYVTQRHTGTPYDML